MELIEYKGKQYPTICGIYSITNPAGAIYIGQSRNINKRVKGYKHKGCRGQPKLYQSLLKYGVKTHLFKAERLFLDTVSQRILDLYEVYYISKYKNIGKTLNIRFGGTANTYHSEETRSKISQTLKGRKITDKEVLLKRKIAATGRKMSDEAKLKMSIASMGNKKGLGKVCSIEKRAKISLAHKGRIQPHMIGDSNPAKTPEAREKIRLSKLEFWANKRNGTYNI